MAIPTSFHPEEERFAAYTRFIERHDLAAMHIALSEGQNLCESARQAMCVVIDAQHDEQHPLPDAIFCQNDETALGAYSALRARGVSVPDRTALAGCDDIPYIRYLETPLTTLSLPVEEVCRQAWEILQRRMAEPDSPPSQVLLEATLIKRASSVTGDSRG
jgi:DNA-binding LacI/PurR family transcriptional regulator